MELATVSDIYVDARGRQHYVTHDRMRNCYWHTRLDYNLGELKLSGRKDKQHAALADLHRMASRYEWTRLDFSADAPVKDPVLP